jgi:hypothetical protein
MGTKKQAEKSKKLWIKVLAILAGIVFVFLMVFSAVGSSWITSLASIKPGDVVVLDYTLKDAQGNPIVTSDQQLYTQLTSQGSNIMFSKPLTITANQSLATNLSPVQVYSQSAGWTNQLALLKTEYDTISSSIVGLKVNDRKTISLPSAESEFVSAQQLALSNLSVSSIQVGDLMPLGVSDTPMASPQSSSTQYFRLAEVVNKTQDGITLDFSYPSIDITVTSINQATS